MDKEHVFYFNKGFQYCMHACGMIHGLMFTNSLEALEYWYAHGIRMFEVDIDITEDGKFVACHEFGKETFEKMEIDEIPEQYTYSWFQKQKLYINTAGGLTPMTLEEIFELLCRHPDMLIMVDPKVYSYTETCAMLDRIKCDIQQYGVDGKRIVFETYNEDMICAVRDYRGLLQFQYCIDDEMQMGTSEKIRSWEIVSIIEFLKENDIYIISYPWKIAVEHLEKLKRIVEEGFLIFSKTRNDILADLLKKSKIGVNIIDYLVTDEQRKALKKYREEYRSEYETKINQTFGLE